MNIKTKYPFDAGVADMFIKQSARRYRVKLSDVRGRSRKKAVVLARRDAMKRCRTDAQMTLEQIGAAFGRAHSVVLYHLNYSKTKDTAHHHTKR